MNEFWISLVNFLAALWELVASVAVLALPLLPLIAWIAFWLLAVNWTKLRAVLVEGGWIGVLLIALVTVLVWGLISPPADGHHYLFGLQVSNFTGKTVYVTVLTCLALIAGSLQLSGCCSAWCCFSDEEQPEEQPASH